MKLPEPGEDAVADTAGHFPGAEDEEHRHDAEPGHNVGGQPGRDSAKFITDVEWIISRSIFELVTLHIDNIDMLAVSHCWIIKCGHMGLFL